MIGSINLRDSLTFIVKQGTVKKKIFKLVFVKDRADFYIAFPYLKINSFRCGMKSSSQLGIPQTFDTNDTDTRTSTIPVKFSYHESGQVHFKPLATPANAPNLPQTLAKIKTTPINQLKGQHIFTVLLEGFQYFEDLSSKDEIKKANVICETEDATEHLKIVGFAGYSDSQVANKYPHQHVPHITVNFTRPHLPGTLKLGIYVFHGDSIVTDMKSKGKPYILSLVGFKTTADMAQMLYLHASIPELSKAENTG